MKKIIAMLLCVAMVAALGVTAFAEPTTAWHSYAYYWNKQIDNANGEWKSWVEGYAENLGDAKKALAKQQKDYTELVSAIADAVQTARNNLYADYFAMAKYSAEAAVHNAIQEAYAQFQYDLMKAVQDDEFDPSYIPSTGKDAEGKEFSNASNWEVFKDVWATNGWDK